VENGRRRNSALLKWEKRTQAALRSRLIGQGRSAGAPPVEEASWPSRPQRSWMTCWKRMRVGLPFPPADAATGQIQCRHWIMDRLKQKATSVRYRISDHT